MFSCSGCVFCCLSRALPDPPVSVVLVFCHVISWCFGLPEPEDEGIRIVRNVGTQRRMSEDLSLSSKRRISLAGGATGCRQLPLAQWR